MPTIPIYNGPQVREQALRPVQGQAADVSSGYRALGAGLGQVAEVVDKIDLQEAETKANETDTQLTQAFNKWEDENRGKYTNQSAKGYTAAVEAWWRDAAKTYGADLSPRARALVNKTLVRRQTVALDQAGKYEFAENEKYADSTAMAAMDNATRNALRTFDYSGESQRVRDLAAQMGARKNWDKEQRDAFVAGQLGKFHTAVVTQMAEKDAAAAKTYLEAAIKKGEIGDNQTRLEAVIKGEADNQFATQKAAEWASLPLADQIANASKITDPQQREKTLQQVRNNYALVKQAQQEQENAAADQAWQLVGRGQRVPESILSQMDGRARVQLQEHIADRARIAADRARSAGNAPIKTDWQTYIDLREKLARGEKVDLRPYAGTKIAPAQLEQLLDIQTKAKTPGKAPEVATSEQQISTYVNRLRIKDEDKGQFMSQAYTEFNEVLKRTGKEPSFDERQKILDRLTMDVVTDKGLLWDTKEKGYKLTPEQRAQTGFSAQPGAQSGPEKFNVGQVYRDKAGNRAKYLGSGKWEPVR